MDIRTACLLCPGSLQHRAFLALHRPRSSQLRISPCVVPCFTQLPGSCIQCSLSQIYYENFRFVIFRRATVYHMHVITIITSLVFVLKELQCHNYQEVTNHVIYRIVENNQLSLEQLWQEYACRRAIFRSIQVEILMMKHLFGMVKPQWQGTEGINSFILKWTRFNMVETRQGVSLKIPLACDQHPAPPQTETSGGTNQAMRSHNGIQISASFLLDQYYNRLSFLSLRFILSVWYLSISISMENSS